MKNNNISSRQMIIMLTIFRVTMSLSYFNSMNFPPANQDNWIIILGSFFYISILSIPILFLTNKFNNYDMIGYFSIILGKCVGKIVSIIYGLYFFIYTIYLIILEQQFVSESLLPNTLNWLLISTLLIVSLYILSKGLVLIFWSGELVLTISFIGIVFLLILGLKNVDINVIFPILRDSTLSEINKGSFLSSLIFVDIFLLTMGGRYLENKKEINKIFLKSTLFSVLIVATCLIVIQTSVGIEQSKYSIYPFLLYTRLIRYKSMLERIDILYMITWLSAHTGKVAIYLLFSLMSFKENFNIKKDKWIAISVTILILLISSFISNRKIFGINLFILKSVLYIPLIFTTIIPIFICVVYFFRRKTLKKYTIEERQL